MSASTVSKSDNSRSSSGAPVSTQPTASMAATAVPATPHVPARVPTAMMFSRGNLESSRLGTGKAPMTRPSTSVRGAGYAKNANSTNPFDKILIEKAKQRTMTSATQAVEAAKEANPQIKYKHLETKIMKLMESSLELSAKAAKMGTENGNGSKSVEIKMTLTESLNKAKEAFSLDRTLHRFRDQHGENMYHNFDLTYSVFFNLAEQYENNDMHIEALNTYSIMTKNKMFPYVNQLKLNMGNIYFKMGLYLKAIKMYRMALDQVPNSFKQLRLKITQNIGIVFVRMGQYADAAASFEFIMSERADIQNGVHLILCYYALGDVEKMKSTFRNLCDAQLFETSNDIEAENENSLIKIQQLVIEKQQREESEKLRKEAALNAAFPGDDTAEEMDTNDNEANKSTDEDHDYVLRALKCDELANYAKQCKNNEKSSIVMVADLISPVVEESYNDGYNWCIEVIKTSNLAWLGSELELNKALVYLRQNDITQAIETLQVYDRKSDSLLTATALINLLFIYINLSNLEMATHCVTRLRDLGVMESNPLVLNNASIVEFQKQNYEAALGYLKRALELQPDNFEANYNLGLLSIEANDLSFAKEQFDNLKYNMTVSHPHVHYQLAKLQEGIKFKQDNVFESRMDPMILQLYLQVLGLSAAEIDSHLVEKVGHIYERLENYEQANHYYNEAFRINPSDIGIATSIGSYYVKLQAVEKAMFYYERAVLADPKNPKLMLCAASCFKNSFMPPKQYLAMFEKIYALFPDDIACVGALMQVTKHLNMTKLYEKYAQEYAHLQKLQEEQQNEQRNRLASARGSGRLRRDLRFSTEGRTVLPKQSEEAHGSAQANRSSASLRFTDPLGPPAERPRTGIAASQSIDSDTEDLNTDSLLPF